MPKPEVVRTPDGKVNLIRPTPPLENLVLRGGGVKGIGNPPALVVMENNGMLNGLNHVVGTSAGALTALCLASGSSAADFQTLSNNNSPGSLTDSPNGWEKRYPMVDFGKMGYNAAQALELGDKTSAENVATYLNDKWDSLQAKVGELSEDEKLRLDLLRKPDLNTDRTGKMVTFKDMEMLHKLAPEKFKELTLTGVEDANKEVRYFNAKDYPDMPIAIAGRISMSIPGVFASVNYDPGDGQGKRHFVDGGLRSNMPSEVVTRTDPSDENTELTGRARENVLVRTGIMTFDEGGAEAYAKTLDNIAQNKRVSEAPKPEGLFAGVTKLFSEKEVKVTPLEGAYKAMHGAPTENEIKDSWKWTQDMVGNIGATDRWDQEKMAESAANCLVIAHGELDTGSFVHYDSTAVNAKQQATKLMQEQVDNRKDFGAYSQTFDSMDEVYAELTASEKAEILKAAPDPTKYMEGTKYKEGTDSPGYKADLELYDKVLSESLKQKQSQELDGGNVHKTSVRELMTKNESSKEAPTKLKVDENEEVDTDEPKVEAPHGTISVKEAMGKGTTPTTTTTPKVDSVNKITL